MMQGIWSDDEDDNYVVDISPDTTGVEEQMTISMQALSGSPHPQTLCISRRIRGQDVVILLDPDSTPTFVNETAVCRLQLLVNKTKTLKVMVASGDKIARAGMCHDVTLMVQQEKFTTDFYVISLGDHDVILGVIVSLLEEDSFLHVLSTI